MSAKFHPGNRLYNGEVIDFRDAMRAVVAECDYEIRLKIGDEKYDKPVEDEMTSFKTRAQRALGIFNSTVTAAEASAVKQMREVGLDEFANALESGDYSSLAI